MSLLGRSFSEPTLSKFRLAYAYEQATKGRRQPPLFGRVWKGWKDMQPASYPAHTLWKSLRDSHIPTASATGEGF